ncbi:MAG: NAD(P)H-binding protein [Spirochaetota bacterium]
MILVAGASGNLGREVAERLHQEGHKLRLLLRNVKKDPQIEGAELVQGDCANPESLEAAFDAAAKAKEKNVVYTSFQGASPESKFPFACK